MSTTADSGAGSLRQAITTANTTAAADTISFAIGSGLRTIALRSTLPAITAPLTIDGATQPGFAGKPLIVINGAQIGGEGNRGLTIQAAHCAVKSLVIGGFSGSGIVIEGSAATGNTVTGCYIGTNAAGTAAVPNSGNGITIFAASDNLIGGTTAAARNLISGNNDGINIVGFGIGAASNKVQGNFIGTNAAGTAALPNGNAGVFIESGAKNTLIGGATATARNVISGNGGTGVIIFDGGTDGTTVQGNFIGTTVTGNTALPNFADGVTAGNRSGSDGDGPKNTVIGGISTSPGSAPGNVISSNAGREISIGGAGTNDTRVQGNLIGTNASGLAALEVVASSGPGVLIGGGAQGTLVGGTSAGARNVISGNDTGVFISGDGPSDNLTVSNAVQGNYIGTNISGSAAIGNRLGVLIIGAKNNLVGAAMTTVGQAPGNVIAGNLQNQVRILGDGASSNLVQGNLIGTNKDGSAGLGSAAIGVGIESGAQNNLIGGESANLRNVISGNSIGVSISGAGTDGNKVQGNLIGANARGAALGNTLAGVEITSGAVGNLIGAAATATDAATRAGGNRIAFNGNSGVRISEETTFKNTVRGNLIFSNGGLGINLEPASENPDPFNAKAPTPNDSGDGDSGPNHLQNFPIITALSAASGQTTVSGTLNSQPGNTYVVDFYRNTQGDPSGFGEGEIYLGSKRVSTGTTGNAAFSFSATGTFSGPTISATATNLTSGETSEFGPLSLSNVVTNTNDDGPGSLRLAMRVASVLDNTTVRFNIPAALAVGGVFTIKPHSPLPAIDRSGTIIDGATQTAFTGNTNAAGPEVVINGGAMAPDNFSAGLVINADNCALRNLVVSGFPSGIDIFGSGANLVASGNKIESCYIGTTAGGTAAATAANVDDGIRLGDDGFTPGTGAANTTISGNVISNNGRFGIVMVGGASGGNQVRGNFIGTNPAGTTAVPNARGVGIFAGSHDNLIGGTTATTRNLIFGNGDVGIVTISDAGTHNNVVQGNYIGVNKAGAAALVTGDDVPDIFGVRITDGAQNNLVGGPGSGAGNVIAGITNGIGIRDVGTTGNVVQGNLIGLSASGTVALPNVGNGIIISTGAQNNVIGAPRNATVAAVASAGNHIANSMGGDGIRVFASPGEQTVGNTIRGNTISNSAGLGINLFPATEAEGTVTPNDNGDADSGPNRQQNFPVITGVTVAGSNTTITGTLNSTAGKVFVIDLYSNANDSSACGVGGGVAEGELYLASQSVTTLSNGNASFTFTVTSAGDRIFTVTATSASSGDTSEFSPTSSGGSANTVTNSRDSGAGSLRAALAAVGACGNSISFDIPQSDSGFSAATGAFTINIASPLPDLAKSGVLLDGTTQPGFAGRPLIVLNGSSAGATTSGLELTAANCVVKGLVISGFKGAQLRISGTGASGNAVQGCFIGTTASGSAGVAGGGDGIVISGGASHNIIGGVAAGQANLIAFNGGDGVLVGSGATDSATGNSIRGNRIFGNSGLGINLNGGSQDSHDVTANDSGDADTGPNNLQNYPVISGLHISGTSAVGGTIDLTLSSKPSSTFAIDFYRLAAPDTSGFGEGDFYLGSRTITTDASGNYAGTLSFSLGSNFAEQSLCATATNLTTGDSSEFGPGQMLVGTVNTWGYNNLGQLGNGSTTNRSLPQAINLSGVVAVAAGGAHSLGVKSDGTVWGWGNNSAGQLGDGTGSNRLTPVQVPGFSEVETVAGGWYHSLALKRDGTVWSWGSNTYGQLGDGTTLASALPVQVHGLGGVTAVAAGVYYSVALKSDGTVWCWGNNFYGQLGDGTKTDRTTPVQVKGVSGIRAIAAGAGHTVLLKSDGTVLAFGWNANGQLGNGSTTDSLTPVTVRGLSRVGLIAAGYAHTLAADAAGGGISAWGSNASGQLGDGSSAANRLTPVRVSNLSGVRLLAAGTSHSLAVKDDGTLWSWGNNLYGAVGDGTTTNRTVPVQTHGLGAVGAISGGFSHSIALGTRAAATVAPLQASPITSGWSSVTASVADSSVRLRGSAALDPASAGDASHYNVVINGIGGAVASATYSAIDNSVTLQLPPGALRGGDEVRVVWKGLRDQNGQPFPDGQQKATTLTETS